MTSFSKWGRDAYRARVGEEEAARRRGAIMARQWGHHLVAEVRAGRVPSVQEPFSVSFDPAALTELD